MSSKPAINLSGVSKSYDLYPRPADRFKDLLLRRPCANQFTALSDINLSVPKGAVVGIVGANGSGKSTLLQIVCGTLNPSAGKVDVDGKVAALLELGLGFDMNFSGRENVYLTSALNGMTRKTVDRRMAEVESFADIGLHFDHPMKTYSTGMIVRVAFAAAMFVDADILIIDEALAVGDEAFQRKCFAKIEGFKSQGKTILFVSHSTATVLQLCDHALLLDRGEMLMQGRPKDVVNQYQRLQNLQSAEHEQARNDIKNGILETTRSIAPASQEKHAIDYDPSLISQSKVIYETQGATISDIHIVDMQGKIVNVLSFGTSYKIVYDVTFESDAENIGFGILFKTLGGVDFAGSTTAFDDRLKIPHVTGGRKFKAEFEFTCLLGAGTYLFNVGVVQYDGLALDYLHRVLDAALFKVHPDKTRTFTSILDMGIIPKIRDMT